MRESGGWVHFSKLLLTLDLLEGRDCSIFLETSKFVSLIAGEVGCLGRGGTFNLELACDDSTCGCCGVSRGGRVGT